MKNEIKNPANPRMNIPKVAGIDIDKPFTQVIRQLIIPEKPVGLVGEKVVYNQKYLKECINGPSVPLPDCGYFIITKACLLDDGKVMVSLFPFPEWRETMYDGTHIAACNLSKYKSNGSE